MSLPNSPLTVFNFGDIVIYSPRWQCMVMLFAALSQVRGGMTKADTIAFIRDQRWFDIQPEDRLPYPSNKLTSKEPRWMTIIAWARKDGVQHRLMHKGGFNDWDLNAEGLDSFGIIARACRDARIDVRRCYLWARPFKLRMNPSYPPDAKELKRPMNLYEGDWVLRNLDFLLGLTPE